jgi:hypothetical protein
MVGGQKERPDLDYHNSWYFSHFLEYTINTKNYHVNLPYYNYLKITKKKFTWSKKQLHDDEKNEVF